MATTSNQLASPYCSLSSSTSTSWDVFLSLYGKDTRRNFTSHLYSALVQVGLRTFMDEPELEKGKEISRGLLDAIHGSKIFIVVLSENYASSRWCLNELVEILTCKRTNGHAVIPVFYYVDPSELRHHKGSFGHALDFHKKRYSVDIIENWKSALAEIAELSGYHLKTDANENESATIQEIVKNVTPLICTKDLHLEEYLVGIDSSVEEVYEKLSMETNDVRAIGICGMGGIGKTTTAKAFYNKYFTNFDTSCFVDYVKQHSQGGSNLLPLLQQLSVELFGKTDYKVTDVKSGIRKLKQFLSTRKALIVLDDLDQSSYSELLVRVCNLVVAGSRIIFTTRDANLVNQLKEDISKVDIYMMRGLKEVDSLELFSYHAFRKRTPPESFKELSVSFLTYAGGLPLALKVLGSSFLGRTDVLFWADKLKNVKKFGENDIQQILRMSYDELGNETQRAIFLDIAFFFVGRDKDEAVHIFKSCGFFPNEGIPVLVERCLLTITKDNKFQMHNLIQDMGNKVIHEESEHGNCRHLYLGQENASKGLQKLEGTEKLEGLIVGKTMSPEKRHLSAKILERMPKLRLLKIFGAHDIKGNFKNSLHELRCLWWDFCPWKRFPSSFGPQNLVSLDMQHSELKKLWKGVTPSVNLKTINLSNSRNLETTPDFTNSTLVDKLVLRGCRSLMKVHPSIGQLTDLSHLDLRECGSLKKLPETIGQLINLNHLDLSNCVNLKRLPEAMKQLTALGSLNLSYCRNLTRLPEQLGDMKCLKMLDASCTSIEQLPDSITNLKELVELRLYYCLELRKLPEQIGNMESLKFFYASSSAIEHLPDTFVDMVNLVKLKLRFCSKLKQLPEQLGKMQCLKELDASATAIEELPDSIEQLTRLKVLSLNNCHNLRNLPSSIYNLTSVTQLSLHQEGMKILELHCSRFPLDLYFSTRGLGLGYESHIFYSLSMIPNPIHLELCNWTSSLPELPLNLKTLSILKYASLEPLPDLSSLKQLHRVSIEGSISLQSLPPLPPHLKRLDVQECPSLRDVPDLSNLKELEYVSFSKCSNLKSLPPLPPHLEELDVKECPSLQDEPDLSNLKELEIMRFRKCDNLKSLPPLPPHLKILNVEKCPSLQDVPDLSNLKELEIMRFRKCDNLKSISLSQSSLQAGRKIPSFKATIPNREVAEWFSYKSSGDTLSFTIPPELGDNLFGVGFWIVVYKSKYAKHSSSGWVEPVITVKTKHKKRSYDLPKVNMELGEQVQSNVACLRDDILISGHRIEVSFRIPPHKGYAAIKVKMCGAHIIEKAHS